MNVCDKCGAPALTIFANKDGKVLVFCAHHGRDLLFDLTIQGWEDVTASSMIEMATQ